MKYIGNAFSPAMIRESDDVLVSIRTITENQFRKVRNHAKSVIGHPELAEYFDLPLNRETVRLKKGDMLYIVLPSRRHKEGRVVHYGDERGKYDVKNNNFVYKIIQVVDG